MFRETPSQNPASYVFPTRWMPGDRDAIIRVGPKRSPLNVMAEFALQHAGTIALLLLLVLVWNWWVSLLS